MKTKHTPGEWIIGNKGNEIIAMSRKSAPNNYVVATVNPNFDTEANAKLIAAAPQLLEALIEGEKYFKAYENHEDNNGQTDLQIAEHYMAMMHNVIVKAIKKATE